jgi:Mg/Co/Ni transporter MgtE
MLRRFLELHPDDATTVFESLDISQAQRLFGRLPTKIAAELLERVNEVTGVKLLEKTEAPRVVELLLAISLRKASALIHHFEESAKSSIFDALPEREARALRELAFYAEESAGAMMEPRVA